MIRNIIMSKITRKKETIQMTSLFIHQVTCTRCLFCFAITLAGCDYTRSKAPPSQPLVVEKDFGVIQAPASGVGELSHKFALKNIFDQTVRPIILQKTCDCTSIEFSSQTLKPNEECTILAKVRVGGGFAKRTITINVGDENQLQLAIYKIKYEQYPKLVLNPNVLTFTDAVTNEKHSKIVQLNICGLNEDDIKHSQISLGMDSTTDSFQVKIGDNRLLEKLEGGIFRLAVPIEITYLNTNEKENQSSFGNQLNFNVNGERISLKLEYRKKSIISPSEIFFGTVSKSESRTKEYRYTFLLNREIDIKKTPVIFNNDQQEFVSIKSMRKMDDKFIIEFQLTPDSMPIGITSGIITLKYADQPTRTFPIKYAAIIEN